jgi:CXXX repeat modification system protein
MREEALSETHITLKPGVPTMTEQPSNQEVCPSCQCAREKRPVGKVTLEEKEEIKRLFERRNGLAELFLTLTEQNEASFKQSPLAARLTKDIEDCAANYHRWWDEKSIQYAWEQEAEGKWEINFETGMIYLSVCQESSTTTLQPV